jgi:hypothetical protein
MKIDRHNYEEYIIDFLEGQLNSEGLQAMQLFLQHNPDIEDEVESMRQTELTVDGINYTAKNKLYRKINSITEINEKNFEELCIAYLEGDLDNMFKDRLLNYIEKDKDSKNIFLLYQAIRFKSDTRIQYPNKKLIKKYVIPVYRKILIYGTSVASTIIIALVLILHPDKSISTSGITSNLKRNDLNVNPIDGIKNNSDRNNSEVLIIKSSKSDRLAAIDTNQNFKKDIIRLAVLKPINVSISETVNDTTLHKKTEIISLATIDNSNNKDNEAILAESQQRKRQSDNILIKALKLGVKGISDLTESEIKLSTQTDDEGNLTAFALSAGEFEIARKINSKSQKN